MAVAVVIVIGFRGWLQWVASVASVAVVIVIGDRDLAFVIVTGARIQTNASLTSMCSGCLGTRYQAD